MSTIERTLRKANRFDDQYLANFQLYFGKQLQLEVQQYLDACARQWNVHQKILMVNLNRLFYLIPRFTLKDYLTIQQEPGKPYVLSIEDWFIVLEFYLQMDSK